MHSLGLVAGAILPPSDVPGTPPGCSANDVGRWLCWPAEREKSAVDKLERLKELFAGRHFDREAILLCVRWYLRFKLSLRDLVEMMAERGLSLAHTTIMRWVQHYTPEFEKRLAPTCPCRRPVMAWSTRHTSKSKVCGTIYIVPWTGRAVRLTSG